MKYMTQSGDTVDGVAFKLGYNGEGAALFDQGENTDVLLRELARRMPLPAGLELDVPAEWDQAPPTLVWNPDTHTPPIGGQGPMPMSAADKRAREAARAENEQPSAGPPPWTSPASASAPSPSGVVAASPSADAPIGAGGGATAEGDPGAADPSWMAEARAAGWRSEAPRPADRPENAPTGPSDRPGNLSDTTGDPTLGGVPA